MMRCLATTDEGYMALVSHQVEIGDFIYLLFGSSVFYVLRPKGGNFSNFNRLVRM
jgi:hypothetical protein